VDRFLGFLSSSEKSPNTVKSYAHDLKDWFCYLSGRSLAWDQVTLEDVAGFVAWLRLPPRAWTGRHVAEVSQSPAAPGWGPGCLACQCVVARRWM
jgi:site-specific recombinase XerD